jgi:uncharacterized SAM-binding protein YcdF (DUF218 family)
VPAIGPPRPLQRQKPRRRPRHRLSQGKQRRIGWRARAIVGAFLGIIALFGWAIIARATAPKGNTRLLRFDVIVVLAGGFNRDGTLTPTTLSRVAEGVREYDRGVAPRLLLTGDSTEARLMERAAEAEGIPESAIVLDMNAKDTITNACNSARIMKQRGWRSVEVVSNAPHLPRTAIILSRLPIEWRVHVAPDVAPVDPIFSKGGAAVETLKTVRYLVYANWTEPCAP